MLRSIAIGMVKSKADAEDIVQDTFLKWLSIEKEKINNTQAYLIKSVTNNCINHLQALKRKKLEYLDQINLPELLTKFRELDMSQIDLNANIQTALKVIHNKLEPLERAVFVLREVFNFDYEALQEVLEKKKDHCRQLFSRAKKKLAQESLKMNVDWPAKPLWVENFTKACEMGFSNDLIKSLTSGLNPA
ncbi:MAG: sigma-70 family RNA polymerase sigma factor [Cyclobacteriaceae bacterium]|nr:sigma-70 family RNA polymerase sigma factor [Cyclobacteriaceae bacterium]